MSRVAVVLVNWNGWKDTVECLESLFRLDDREIRVIVCDNASSDGSVDRVKAWANGLAAASCDAPATLRQLVLPPVVKPIPFAELDRATAEVGGDPDCDPPLIIIRTGGNLGFAGGNNVGLRYLLARGGFDFAWLLNNDTVVDPASLGHLVAEFSSRPQLGICGSTLLCYDDPSRIQALGGGYYCRWIGLPWLHGRWRRMTPRHLQANAAPFLMNYVVGASMLVSREFIERVGLMAEDYFLFFEETDWAWRGRGRFALGWAPRSLVYHKIGRSIGTSTDPRRKSATCDYYALRNRLLFTRRFCKVALPTVWLSLLGALLIRILSGRRDLVGPVWKLLTGRQGLPPVGR
jgi:hypothetical protein